MNHNGKIKASTAVGARAPLPDGQHKKNGQQIILYVRAMIKRQKIALIFILGIVLFYRILSLFNVPAD